MSSGTLKAGLNHVIVRPIGDVGVDRESGIVIAEYVDDWMTKSCMGIVEDVGDLYCGAKELAALGKKPAGQNRLKAMRINEVSLDYDVPCEVTRGDIVLFKYLPNVDKDAAVEGRLIVRYDQLLAKVSGSGIQGLYPLNGAIFLQVQDANYVVGGMRVVRTMEPGWGTVVAQGCLVEKYLYWNERPGDANVDLFGKEVCFRDGMAVRIDHEAYKNLDIDTEYPLYYLHRTQINAYRDGSDE